MIFLSRETTLKFSLKPLGGMTDVYVNTYRGNDQDQAGVHFKRSYVG